MVVLKKKYSISRTIFMIQSSVSYAGVEQWKYL